MASNTQTEAEQVYDRVQRAFKANDPQENGYIPSTQLGTVLRALESEKLQESVLGDESGFTLGRLHSHLEISGAGIILWDDLWKAVSVLMMGGKLEDVRGA